MKQLTTTNNQFKLEESLMERIFESCGYRFTIITLRNSEPHFIAKEISEASLGLLTGITFGCNCTMRR